MLAPIRASSIKEIISHLTKKLAQADGVSARSLSAGFGTMHVVNLDPFTAKNELKCGRGPPTADYSSY